MGTTQLLVLAEPTRVCHPRQRPGGEVSRHRPDELNAADEDVRGGPTSCSDVVAALDAHAGRLGLSRSEYVRRRLAQDAATSNSPVSVADLARFAEVFGDLADPDVMSRAWQ